MIQRVAHFLQKEPTIWGPLSLFCTLAIGVKAPFDLLLVAATGFFLCARWQLRGFAYSLALLAMTAVVKHAFFISDHLWYLGLEGSLACAFFITSLTFEEATSCVESLESQLQVRKAALENLEEELAKVRQSIQEEQIAFQEKRGVLQKELEDLQADHSSILILNEVLRKTTARYGQEKEHLTANALDLQGQKEILKGELEECRRDLARFANTDAVAIQNAQLMKELNGARYEKEQTHLINETLARLYLRESLKAKDADQEAASLSDQLSAVRKEISILHQQPAPESDPQMVEQLAFAQEKMLHLSQIEPLFKQLKRQFEEKNQILHQTRSDLFKSDTELQKLKMEKQVLEFYPIPKEMEEELQEFSGQIVALEEENHHLQELVSILTESSQERKKKVKTASPPVEQGSLF